MEDYSRYFRNTIGYDHLMNTLASCAMGGDNYPPYNIEVLDENKYQLTLAVAGFNKDELDITVDKDLLTVSGDKPESTSTFLHKGIAFRKFKRVWKLSDYLFVESTSLVNGLLTINLERRVPEELKPRKIEING